MAEGTINPRDRKAYLYGGHDSTITNLLRTLNVWEPQFPGYAITVLFELYKDTITNRYGVQVSQKPPDIRPKNKHKILNLVVE